MTNYYELINGEITRTTTNLNVAQEYINYQSTDDKIVRVDNGKLMLQSDYDIYIQSPDYIAEQKTNAKKSLVVEYKEYFNELNTLCALKYALGLCTTEQISAQRVALQSELTTKLSEV